MSKNKKNRIKRPSILSLGLLELAANECGFSCVAIMREKDRIKAVRGLKHLRRGK